MNTMFSPQHSRAQEQMSGIDFAGETAVELALDAVADAIEGSTTGVQEVSLAISDIASESVVGLSSGAMETLASGAAHSGEIITEIGGEVLASLLGLFS
jgi:hypothetical protein